MKSIVFSMNLICSCRSLQWGGGWNPLSYPTWWNPLQCAKRGHPSELLIYNASRLIVDGCRPTQRKFSQWTFVDIHLHLTLPQMMHSQRSNEHPTHGCDFQQIPPPPSSSWERHKTLCHLLIAHLKWMCNEIRILVPNHCKCEVHMPHV